MPATQTALLTHADALSVLLLANRLRSERYKTQAKMTIHNTVTSQASGGIPLPNGGPDLARLRVGDEALIYADFEGMAEGIPSRLITLDMNLGHPDMMGTIKFIL